MELYSEFRDAASSYLINLSTKYGCRLPNLVLNYGSYKNNWVNEAKKYKMGCSASTNMFFFLLIIKIKTQEHANVVVVDVQRGVAERFEPQLGPEHDKINDFVTKNLENALSILFPSVVLVPLEDACPFTLAPQRINPDDLFCVGWSVWWLELRLRGMTAHAASSYIATKGYDELVNYMLKVVKWYKDKINKSAQYKQSLSKDFSGLLSIVSSYS